MVLVSTMHITAESGSTTTSRVSRRTPSNGWQAGTAGGPPANEVAEGFSPTAATTATIAAAKTMAMLT
jgi:hypothetical protein